jgi:hypothetical protein
MSTKLVLGEISSDDEQTEANNALLDEQMQELLQNRITLLAYKATLEKKVKHYQHLNDGADLQLRDINKQIKQLKASNPPRRSVTTTPTKDDIQRTNEEVKKEAGRIGQAREFNKQFCLKTAALNYTKVHYNSAHKSTGFTCFLAHPTLEDTTNKDNQNVTRQNTHVRSTQTAPSYLVRHFIQMHGINDQQGNRYAKLAAVVWAGIDARVAQQQLNNERLGFTDALVTPQVIKDSKLEMDSNQTEIEIEQLQGCVFYSFLFLCAKMIF